MDGLLGEVGSLRCQVYTPRDPGIPGTVGGTMYSARTGAVAVLVSLGLVWAQGVAVAEPSDSSSNSSGASGRNSGSAGGDSASRSGSDDTGSGPVAGPGTGDSGGAPTSKIGSAPANDISPDANPELADQLADDLDEMADDENETYVDHNAFLGQLNAASNAYQAHEVGGGG